MMTPDTNEDSSSSTSATQTQQRPIDTGNNSANGEEREGEANDDDDDEDPQRKILKRKNDDEASGDAQPSLKTSKLITEVGKCENEIVQPVRQAPLTLSVANWISEFSAWTNEGKANALTHLMESCENSLIRHVNAMIEPKLQRDYVTGLPREVQLLMLKYLSAKDLSRLAQVSNYWRLMADDSIVWKKLCIKHKMKEVLDVNSAYYQSASAVFRRLNYWKATYSVCHNVILNWTTRTLPQPIYLKGHDEHVITCLKCTDSCIVSGSDDNTIKIWCAKTGKVLNTLAGHTGGVWTLQLKDDLIISGSTDRTLRIWRMDTGECLHVLFGHTSTVRCLALHDNIAVSGSRDASLRVWDIESGKCVNILRGHAAAVRCVCFDGKLVVSGSYDFTVRVWNPLTRECMHTLDGHTNRVYSLLFENDRIISGSLDTTIIVWDVKSGAMLHRLEGHQSLTSRMQIKGDILVSGNADSHIKIWSIESGKCLHTLGGAYKHGSAVTCLVISDNFVISSSDDGTVKLWNLETGEFIRNLLTLENGGYHGGVVWRINVFKNKLVCAVGSRNGIEDTKLILYDFEWPIDQY